MNEIVKPVYDDFGCVIDDVVIGIYADQDQAKLYQKAELRRTCARCAFLLCGAEKLPTCAKTSAPEQEQKRLLYISLH